MSYKQYNTRSSSEYNVPGTFVPAELAEVLRVPPRMNMPSPKLATDVQLHTTPWQNNPEPDKNIQDQATSMPAQMEIEMKNDGVDTYAEDAETKPIWMKSKLQGVKKISNRERRRRQNENLRRLLTPKNALMVLNEIMPGEQVANQFKVEPVPSNNQYYRPSAFNFRADLTLHGNNYKGFGENKLTARNAAAEQAIRDLMIRRMTNLLTEPADDNSDTKEEDDDESIPMIQLASYALHKLFTEWEFSGHKVPPLKQQTTPAAESRAPSPRAAPARPLPAGHRAMHPCMLLGHMRPQLEYVQLPPDGDKQHNMLFNIVVEVDGQRFYGKAPNKKEARKAAAKAACERLFNVEFEN